MVANNTGGAVTHPCVYGMVPSVNSLMYRLYCNINSLLSALTVMGGMSLTATQANCFNKACHGLITDDSRCGFSCICVQHETMTLNNDADERTTHASAQMSTELNRSATRLLSRSCSQSGWTVSHVAATRYTRHGSACVSECVGANVCLS